MIKRTTRTASAALFAGVSACALMAAPAFAQDEAVEREDRIVVTGSRIARDPNLTEPLPVQSLDAEALRLSGESDITEVINDIPALLTTTTAAGSIDGIFGDAVGGSLLNLRGLGAERTLVLVNGQRHVGGVAGTAIVDINSIPTALVERIDVVTGGASQVYGADAVTGVVNFVLRDRYEGLSLDVNGGISTHGDGERYKLSGIAGRNFLDDRLNVTLAVDYSKNEDIRLGDREFSRDNGIYDDLPNPARRFQSGDISASATPNFFARFNPAVGRYPTGFAIPTLAQAESLFGAGNLTPAELALIDRAATAPTRAILPQPTFSISSSRGVIAPGDFSSPNIDLNNNGVPDCLDSSVGFNSSFDFASSFGAAGGCWVVNDDGSVRPFQDGLIAGTFNQFGGDGIQNNFNEDYAIPDLQNVVGNLLISYDLAENVELFVDAKFGYAEATFGGPLNTFYDLLTIAPDNPYIPDELFDLAQDTGGLFVTRDPTDLGPNVDTQERRTYRVVTGVRAEGDNGWTYELTGNYGRFERESTDRNRVIMDRFFAAIDATTDGAGNPVCRSSLDPNTVSPTTPFDIPLFDFGYFTFNPGDGQCRPANILGGPNSISQEAVDFITTTVVNNFTLEQWVVNGLMTGDFDEWVKLPGGSIGFAAGFEYRQEESTSVFDPLVRGILPVSTPDGDAGDFVGDLGVRQTSLVFDPASLIRDADGEYDVWEVFGEMTLPIITDAPFFNELSVGGGVRFSDYSTVGSTFSWGTNLTWSPVEDLTFRATYAKPIRAPNISELFDPELGAFFRPVDPCDQAEIDALVGSGDPRGAIRAANCQADGIAPGFADPLSARFSGVTSGNPELQEERARTFSGGVIFEPSFFDGFTLTVDYWDIRIEDAIVAVSAQDIVDNCYDSTDFPNNEYCPLFTRNRDPLSPQFLGFNFLRQTQVNFASIASSGIDFQSRYDFSLLGDQNEFSVLFQGSWMRKLDNFFDPGDPTNNDPELGELQRPELSGNASLVYRRGPLQMTWQTQYQGVQGLRAVEIETVDTIYGPAGLTDRVFIHDLNVSYDVQDNVLLYGGVNNVLDRDPFVTEQSFPVSPLGRYFFIGARVNL